MPRITIVGNCQAIAIADVVRFLLPDAFVKHVVSWEIPRWYPTEQTLYDDLNAVDLVCSHSVPMGNFPIATVEQLREKVPGVLAIPNIVFSAYHPDLIYVNVNRTEGSTFLLTPLGPYNSAIALMAYKLGLEPNEALRLYTPEVYERLGYFDMWPDAQTALLQSGRDVELPIEESFLRWTREGCFMHSINHATIAPLGDVARLLLQKAGIRTAASGWQTCVPDPAQLDAIWPIYPPIAERYGLQGSYTFKRPDYAAKDGRRYYGLEAFVYECFRSYGFFPKAWMASERVDGWLADAELSSWIFRRATTGSR